MSVGYIIKESLSGFGRAKLAAIGSVITISISLILLGLFYVVSTNTARFIESVRQKVELEAFLEEPITPEEINEIQKQMIAIEGIDSVRFISKEEAAKIFKEEFGEDINNILDFNPLPPSFKIILKEGYRTPQRANEIHAKVVGIKGVENIAYRKELLEFLDQRVKNFYTIAFAVGILLAVSAIFLVSNTIRLTIYAKKKSIQTMKLVGASRWFIRAPFLIEGVVQGLIGGIIASGLIYYLVSIAVGFVSNEILDFFIVKSVFYIALVVAGILLGFFGSIVSVRRFIRETIA